jgi:hypothetical protein
MPGLLRNPSSRTFGEAAEIISKFYFLASSTFYPRHRAPCLFDRDFSLTTGSGMPESLVDPSIGINLRRGRKFTRTISCRLEDTIQPSPTLWTTRDGPRSQEFATRDSASSTERTEAEASGGRTSEVIFSTCTRWAKIKIFQASWTLNTPHGRRIFATRDSRASAQ